MESLHLKIVLVALVVAVGLAGGLPLFRRREAKEGPVLVLGEALACGVFLGAGLIHMLNDATVDFEQAGVEYPLAMVIAGIAMLLLLFLEHMGNKLADSRDEAARVLPLLTTVILAIHSFLVGAALGTSDEIGMVVVISLAVVAHKGAAAFALSIELLRSPLSSLTARLCFFAFVAMFPLGCAVGWIGAAATGDHPLWEAVFSSLAAGTFLYLGTLHGLAANTLIARCQNRMDFTFVTMGFVVMAVVAIWT